MEYLYGTKLIKEKFVPPPCTIIPRPEISQEVASDAEWSKYVKRNADSNEKCFINIMTNLANSQMLGKKGAVERMCGAIVQRIAKLQLYTATACAGEG